MSLRPGSKEAKKLFDCDAINTATWQSCLDLYSNAVSAVAGGKSKSDLTLWDKFLWTELPTTVNSRQPAYITLAELADVMKWKLARGKARPLQKLVESNAYSAVVKASTEAFNLLEQGAWEGAVSSMTTLKAVGVATATAILAPFAPASIPFMADEVMEAVSCKRDYTMKIYKEMREALVRKAVELTAFFNAEGHPHAVWTAEEVGKALWTRAMMAVYPAIALSEKRNVQQSQSISTVSCDPLLTSNQRVDSATKRKCSVAAPQQDSSEVGSVDAGEGGGPAGKKVKH